MAVVPARGNAAWPLVPAIHSSASGLQSIHPQSHPPHSLARMMKGLGSGGRNSYGLFWVIFSSYPDTTAQGTELRSFQGPSFSRFLHNTFVILSPSCMHTEKNLSK